MLLAFVACVLLWFPAAAWAAGSPAPGPSPALPPQPSTGAPAAPDQEQMLQRQLQALDNRDLQQALGDVQRWGDGNLPEFSLRQAVQMARQSGSLDPRSLLRSIGRYLFRELVANAGLLSRLIVLAVLLALLQHLSNAFAGDGAGKVAHTAVYLMLIGIAISGFALALGTASGAMDRLTSFMYAVLPTLLGALAAMGGIGTAAIFQPLLLTLVGTLATLLKTLVFPLLFVATLLDVVSGLSEHYKLTGLAQLLRQGAVTVLGLSFTGFLGIVGIKGVLGGVADGVALRSTKFVAGAFIPVVGKLFSDASELILGSSLLLKNTLGVLGAMAILAVVAFPLLKISAIVIVYRLAQALVQPLGAGSIGTCLGAMANNLSLLWVTLAVVTLLFLLTVAAVVGAGNLTAMLR